MTDGPHVSSVDPCRKGHWRVLWCNALFDAITNPTKPSEDTGIYGSMHAPGAQAQKPQETAPVDPYALIPNPPGGWGKPALDGKQLRKRLTTESIRIVETAEGERVFATIFWDVDTNEDIIRGELLHAVLSKFLGADAKIIITAMRMTDYVVGFRAAVLVLISGLSVLNKFRCIEQGTFATAKGAFHIIDHDIPIMDYTMHFKDLALRPSADPAEAERKVQEMIIEKLRSISALNTLIAEHGDALKHVAPDNRLKSFLSSVRASVFEAANKNQQMIPIWSIYIRSFTTDEEIHAKFVAAMKKLSYDSVGSIQGKIKAAADDWHCNRCKAVDHPTGLCPMLRAPGYVDINFADPHHAVTGNVNNAYPPTASFFDIAEQEGRASGPVGGYEPNAYGRRGRGGRGGRGRGSGRGF
ncbi:hypothetical protein D9611_014394 [Ephemerocybe angulata]|uniref:Uncharacterized protein n=1 Tax=Ephemerocybe angulata TaxID=980116 RepID=A0A8H5AR21_9AGAR|nr:hypothetical protein D9611_014394 [Tulosesus angulatus]